MDIKFPNTFHLLRQKKFDMSYLILINTVVLPIYLQLG